MGGSKDNNKRIADEFANKLLHDFTDSLVNGDYEAFRAAFHIPCVIETPRKTYLFSQDGSLRDIFNIAHNSLRQADVQDVISTIDTVAYPSADRTEVTAVVCFNKSGAVWHTKPFPIFFVADVNSGAWGISCLILTVEEGSDFLSES